VRIIDRYVAGTVFRHFAYALAALLAVFAVINFTDELRSTGRAGWGVSDALWFVLLTLPSEAYDLFPAATLVGSVLAFGRMATDHELVALQAAGVSRWRTATAALMAAVILAVAAVALGEMIAAPLSQRAHGQRALALSAGRALSTSSGLWLRDRRRFVNVGELRPDGSLGEVYLFDFDDRRELERFVRARTAEHSGGEWRLYDLHETRFDRDVSENRWMEAAPWTSAIEPTQIRTLWIDPNDLSIGELHRTIVLLRERGQNPLSHEVAFWRRVTAPVYMAAMVLLAMPLVTVSGRAVRVGERVTLAALVGLGFQMFQDMFANLGIVAGFPPVVTAAVPALIAVGVTIALFRWQRLQ
jgi:lipopolysaccharide export system permease protein